MNPRIHLQPAWLIHRRPFRNTSLLVDFFCRDHGRIATVARSARRSKSRLQGLLQPFRPLHISWIGRSEIKTLTVTESAGPAATLSGERLFSGLYINELLSRLLHDHVEHPNLFQTYRDTLTALATDLPLEPILRRFELELLAELGYAINLQTERHNDQLLCPHKPYRYIPDLGFEEAGPEDNNDHKRIFSGAHLLALARLDLTDPATAATAKRLLRQALDPHLGGKPLHSRALFAK